MNNFKVAVIQTDLVWESPKDNIELFSDKIDQLPSEVDLIILPEVFTTGFTSNVKSSTEQSVSHAVSWMKEMSINKSASITGSIITKENNKYHNRLYWVHSDGKIDTYDKGHLFGIEGETKNFTKGTERILIQQNNWRIRPLICYDLRFPVWSRNDDNYDILIYVANWPGSRSDVWLTLLKARAIENQSYVIGCNIVGNGTNGIAYTGDSVVYSPKGEVLWQPKQNAIETGIVELNYDSLHDFRKKFPVLEDRDKFILSDG